MRAVQVEERFFPVNEVVSERFTLGELIGKGSFGEVYRAQDSLIDAEVALRIFAPELIANPHDQEQFLKVARTARTLTQPNVVRVHSGGVHKDHAWVSMQTLDGLSLRKIMKMRRQKRERFPLAEIEPIVSQITLAAGHVHREFPLGNLKPENIIFLHDLIKVTDHYLLAAFNSQMFADGLAQSRYLAPELRAPATPRQPIGEIDPRCDVFSLGAIIGELVFGPDYTPGATSNASGALDALCRRACAPSPEDRYETIEALSEDFATLVDTGELLDAGESFDAAEPPGKHGVSGYASSMPPAAPDRPATAAISAAAPSVPPPAPQPDAGALAVGDDVATREYSRDGGHAEPELGDLLATNEVRREDLRQLVDASVPEPENQQQSAAKPPVAAGSAPRETTATAVKPIAAVQDARKTSNDDSGLSPGLILAAVFALILIGGAVVWGVQSQQSERVELGDSSTAELNGAADDESGEGENSESAPPEVNGKANGEALAAAQIEADKVLLAAKGEALVAVEKVAEQHAETGEEPATDETLANAAALNGSADEQGARDDDSSPDEADGAKKPETSESAKGAAAPPEKSGKSSDDSAAKVAEKQGTKCPSGMRLIKSGNGNYCIDTYEYPGRGSMPKTGVSWFEASQLCAARQKRLCKLSEWRRACGGTYPYGSKWNPNRCNTVDEDAFERSLAAAGSFEGCRSRSGARDMTGNAHEWVAEQRIAGGGYDSGPEVASCRYSSAKAPGSSAPNIGFRCCANPL
jgi:hypothetical protein